MNLAPDDRVNMSLDAIIKTSQQARKAEKKVKEGRKNPRSAVPKAIPDHKIAKSVGQNKANRAAAINQKRGLNDSGKATTQQIKSSEKKQVAKIQAKRPAVKTAALKAQAGTGAKSSGLRITFKPADLGKTTDKIMAAQIRGVLSKDPTSKKADAAKPASAAQGGRKVVQAKAPPKKKIVIRR